MFVDSKKNGQFVSVTARRSLLKHRILSSTKKQWGLLQEQKKHDAHL